MIKHEDTICFLEFFKTNIFRRLYGTRCSLMPYNGYFLDFMHEYTLKSQSTKNTGRFHLFTSRPVGDVPSRETWHQSQNTQECRKQSLKPYKRDSTFRAKVVIRRLRVLSSKRRILLIWFWSVKDLIFFVCH